MKKFCEIGKVFEFSHTVKQSVEKCSWFSISIRNGINFDGYFGSVTAHLKNIIDTIGGGLSNHIRIIANNPYWWRNCVHRKTERREKEATFVPHCFWWTLNKRTQIERFLFSVCFCCIVCHFPEKRTNRKRHQYRDIRIWIWIY